MKLLVGVPCGQMVAPETLRGIAGMLRRGGQPGDTIGLVTAHSSVPSQSQNSIFAGALREGVDAVLLVDSDMDFPPDTAARLLAHGKDIVGGVYRARSHPHAPVFRPLDDKPLEVAARGLLACDFIPSGLMLVRRHVLETLGYPWMEEIYGASPDDLVGHDVWFCRKARQHGFHVWADLTLSHEVRHMAIVPIPLDFGA